MSEADANEADVVEQRQQAGGEAEADRPGGLPLEAAEGDVLEQGLGVPDPGGDEEHARGDDEDDRA